jgi:endonuclease/exonuclease/phosphatase family metal-dependent hydrolase
VLATQRHITRADEELPPCTVSGRVARSGEPIGVKHGQHRAVLVLGDFNDEPEAATTHGVPC